MGYQPTSTAVTAIVSLLFCLVSTARVVDGKPVTGREHPFDEQSRDLTAFFVLSRSSSSVIVFFLIAFLVDTQHARAVVTVIRVYMLLQLRAGICSRRRLIVIL